MKARLAYASALAASTVVLLVFGQAHLHNVSVLSLSKAQQAQEADVARAWQVRGIRSAGGANAGRSAESAAARGEPRKSGPEPSAPPLETLVNGSSIIGNVSYLLDFAIVGHAKTGTTFFKNWLRSSPYVQMPENEVIALRQLKPWQLVERLHALPPGGLRGYKSPHDVADPNALDLIARHWPRAKLIVGLRHPVLWFESFYNFRRLGYGRRLAPPSALIGRCTAELGTPRERRRRRIELNGTQDFDVCTDGARFHVHLSYLGKVGEANGSAARRRLPNPVLLYEASQLDGSDPANRGRFRAFQRDVEGFLGLPGGALDAVPPRREEPQQLARALEDPSFEAAPGPPLDVCLDEHAALRAELMRHAADASAWIERRLLGHPDVTVPSPDSFRAALRAWRGDPCAGRRGGGAAAGAR
jgi:hypothetical protein